MLILQHVSSDNIHFSGVFTLATVKTGPVPFWKAIISTWHWQVPVILMISAFQNKQKQFGVTNLNVNR